MGKLILCSGQRTQRPYGFTSSGIRIYSIEELCYFLYHHVYMIDEAMLNNDLFDWIGTELKLPERAQKLKQLKMQKADLKTIVTVILCSADYYSELEIKSMLNTLDDIIGMPQVKRNCMKAKNYLAGKNYKEAAAEFDRIINSKDAISLSPEEYGDIYHNLAVAKVHISGLKEASRLFSEAYARNHRQESLTQYLYTLLIMNNEEDYIDKTDDYYVSESMKQSIEAFIKQKENEAQETELMKVIAQLKKRKTSGKMNEFYSKSDEIISSWKAQLRQV